MRYLLVAFLFCLTSTTVLAKTNAKKIWTIDKGLAQPESAYYDAGSKSIFVSNVSGDALTKDDKGWISQFTTDGQTKNLEWATSLNAPKGLRSHKGILWVSDIDRVVAFNIKDGSVAKTIPIKDAKCLNDVAIDGSGNVYVSDTMTNTIHIIKPGQTQAEIFVQDPSLGAPNGLIVEGPYLRVVGWGAGINDKWEVTSPGAAISINLKTKKRSPLLDSLGSLDGVEFLGKSLQGFAVSDWVKGVIYTTTKSRKPKETLLADLQGPADIGYIAKDQILLVPEMKISTLSAYKLSK